MNSLLLVVLLVVVVAVQGGRFKPVPIQNFTELDAPLLGPGIANPPACDTRNGWTAVENTNMCYWFSKDKNNNADPRNEPAAQEYCKIKESKLASAGQDSASSSDPLLEYMYNHGMSHFWLGATWTGTKWFWNDGRKLSIGSTMWEPIQPSGDGTCVETLRNTKRNYLNDLSCTSHLRNFVCEKKGYTEEIPRQIPLTESNGKTY